MDYCIKNNRNIYIKLNENGAPTTCVESVKGLFEFSKAKNILGCLPKRLRAMNFKVEPIPEIKSTKAKELTVKEKSIQNKEDYFLTEDITRWIDKFGVCSDVLEEAKERKAVLIVELRNKDTELIDILHIIEIEPPKDLYNGWKLYKQIKANRKERRLIKDELLIVENVLREINPSCVNREQIQKAIDGLFTRKYTFRIIEEGDEHAIL